MGKKTWTYPLWLIFGFGWSFLLKYWSFSKGAFELLGSESYIRGIQAITIAWFFAYPLAARSNRRLPLVLVHTAYFTLLGTVFFIAYSLEIWLWWVSLFMTFLLLPLAWLLFAERIRVEKQSQLPWYIGAATRIQGLTAEVYFGDDRSHSYRTGVTRIGSSGALLTAPPEVTQFLERGQKSVIVEFFFREHSMICQGSMRSSKRDHDLHPIAVSVGFRHENADSKKSLGDFLELLKGAGHGTY